MDYDVRPTRVLAVDDDAFNLDLIEMAFQRDESIEVIRAVNGVEALEALAKHDPDVVLLDLLMPVLDGFGALQRIRADERYVNTPVIVVTANAEEKHKALEIGANDFISKPVDVRELKLRTRNHAKIKAFHDFLQNTNHLLEVKVRERTRELHDALELAHATEREVVLRLGRAAEYRDVETGAHIQRVSRYAELLGRLVGLPDAEAELLRNASTLHDIGEVGIPDAILLKPGKLTPEEFEIMKLHVTIGAKMLQGTERYPLLASGRIIAMQHHEKYDGSGYPLGLIADDIHVYGRIVALADVFDALASARIYKPALPLEEVLGVLQRERGKHFDPQLVDLFLDNLDGFLEIKETYRDEDHEPPHLSDFLSLEIHR
ncbi:MAG TPA: response regulator [Candidatus Krumholzibacteria bacterium]|nr:response regulator [Candidatus Krumholzibacteria bacterium]HRX51747.1 response regulator [Candidatus Krumholzibacteria bacterium]